MEMLLSHLQHDIDKLSEAVAAKQAEIAILRAGLANLCGALEQEPEPPRDPEAERPPHY
jgi:uncharacterized coiled-coil protein SlyX